LSRRRPRTPRCVNRCWPMRRIDDRAQLRTDFVIDSATRRIGLVPRRHVRDRPAERRSLRRAHRAARAQSPSPRRQGDRETRAHRRPVESSATSSTSRSTPTPDRSQASVREIPRCPADAFIGVGRYAIVVVDPQTGAGTRAAAAALSFARRRRSRRTDQTSPTTCVCNGTDQMSWTYERSSVAARRAMTEP